jgi:hypothetical protein
MLFSDLESAHSEQMLSLLEKYSKLSSPIVRKSSERKGTRQNL